MSDAASPSDRPGAAGAPSEGPTPATHPTELASTVAGPPRWPQTGSDEATGGSRQDASRGGVPLPALVAVAVVAVVASVLAVVFYLGKSNAQDDEAATRGELAMVRSDLGQARADLAATEADLRDSLAELQQARTDLGATQTDLDGARAQVADLEDEVTFLEDDLIASEEIGTILGGLVSSGRAAADELFTCADLSRTFILDFFETGTPDVAAAENADTACVTAGESYNAFLDSLAGLEPVAQ